MPDLPPCRTLVVTGTDTDVGKTVVSCALLRMARNQGLAAVGFKPVASGVSAEADGLRNPDVRALQASASVRVTDDEMSPYRFDAPVAPHLAAAQAGQTVRLTRLAEAHAALAARARLVVVEGAGGWLVPLNPDISFGGWVSQQGWPVLLVVGMRLGCINHALLSAEAIHRRAPLVGWVANALATPMPLLQENIDAIGRRLDVPCWGVVAPGAADTATLDSDRFDAFLRTPAEAEADE